MSADHFPLCGNLYMNHHFLYCNSNKYYRSKKQNEQNITAEEKPDNPHCYLHLEHYEYHFLCIMIYVSVFPKSVKKYFY